MGGRAFGSSVRDDGRGLKQDQIYALENAGKARPSAVTCEDRLHLPDADASSTFTTGSACEEC